MRITKAVVPAGGLGTRMLPLTRAVPKELLPIVDKPVVQYVVDELFAAGIEHVLIVTAPGKEAIEEHFRGLDGLSFVTQPRAAGLGDALRQAERFAGGGAVVVALADAIISTPPAAAPGIVRRLIETFETSGAAAAFAVDEVPEELVGRYGIAIGPRAAGAFEVSAVVEKPDPAAVASRTAIMGRYVLGTAVFAALGGAEPDASGEVQLTSALQAVIDEGERVVAVPLGPAERRHDVGSIESYCATFVEFAARLGRPGDPAGRPEPI